MLVDFTTFYIVIVLSALILAGVRAFLEKTSRLKWFFRFAGVVEVAFLSVLLVGLIFFGCLQIVLRNFFHSGILWADPLMRHIVLWLGCMGGVLATARLRHINIDIFTRILPERMRPIRDRIVHLATAIAASILGLAAAKLVVDEKDFGGTAFLGIGVWVLQLILPVAFFLITYRSFVNLILLPEEKRAEWDDPVDSSATDAHAAPDTSFEAE